MAGFEFSAGVNADNVFLVNFLDLQGRLDPAFHNEMPDITNFSKLSNIAYVKGGKRIPQGKSYVSSETPYLYLRVTDFNQDGIIDYDGVNFIDNDVFEELSRYEIHIGQLAISIAGTIGRILLIEDIPHGKKIILTENCAKIILKNTEIDPKYFFMVMNLSIVQKQIRLNYIQTTIPNLGLDRINNLYLPKFPPLATQQQRVLFYQTQFNQKQQKEQQAQALLDSIDGYLLNELGITLPKQDNRLEKRMFTVPFSEVVGIRTDPDYSLKYALLFSQKGYYNFTKLKDLLIGTPQYGANEEGKERITDDDVRYIRITDIDELGILKNNNWKTAQTIDKQYLLNQDDILFARSGSVGRCYIHKETEQPAIFAGYLIRFKVNKERLNPDFLFYYCNSMFYKLWVSAIERPAVQSNINAEEFKALPIALPPIEKQTEIATHITQIRAQAKQLQAEAAKLLATAKADIERIILGS
ncbi:MAG: restriction endonuclease subunit S [Betaproteobacteria bacterium]